MASTSDAVWIEVLPSMKGFMSSLRSQTSGLTAQGQALGREFGAGFGTGSAASVQAASSKMSAALNKVQDATGKVRVAEAQLNQVRASGKATQAQIVAAEEKYEKALRDEATASGKAATAAKGLASAQQAHNDAQAAGTQRTGVLSKATGALSGAYQNLKSHVVGAFLAYQGAKIAINWIGSTITAASNLNEEVNKSTVVFGKSARSVLDWSKNSATAFGQSRQEALASAGTFGNLFRTIGLTDDASAGMSMRLVELAGDLASFNNASPADVLEAMRSGLVGETEPMRRFGVDLSDAALKAESLALGIYSGTGNLTQAQKAQAAYSLMLKQTTLAQGDFARTSDGMANQQRILSAEWANAKGTLGQALLPVMTDLVHLLTGSLIPALTAVAGFVRDNINWIGPLAVALGGIVVVYKAWTAAQWLLNVAMNANPILLIITGLVALGAALYTAYKSSETFRNIVDGVFRDVGAAAIWMWDNALKPTWDAMTAGWSGLATGVSWSWSNVIKPTWDVLAATATWLWNNILGPTFAGIKAAWDVMAAAFGYAWVNVIKPAWDALSASASLLWNYILVPAFVAIRTEFSILAAGIAWAWSNVISPVFDALGAAAGWLWRTILEPAFVAIKAAWDMLATALGWAWTNVISPVFDAFAAAGAVLLRTLVSVVFNPIGTAWNALSASFGWAWDNIIRPVWDAMVTGGQAIGSALSTAWGGIVTAWNTVATGIGWAWSNVIKPVWDAMTTAGQLLAAIIGTLLVAPVLIAWNLLSAGVQAAWSNVIKPVWDAMAAAATWLWQNAIQPAMNGIVAGWQGMATGVQAAWDFLAGWLVAAWNALSAAWTAVWGTIAAALTAAWNTITSIAQTAWNALVAFFTPAWNALSALWSAIWNGISAFFTTTWNAITSFAQTIWNTLAGWWQAAWNALSALWSATWNAILAFFQNIWTTLVSWAQATWNTLSGWWGAAWNALSALWSAIWNGISAFFTTTWNTISSTAQTIWNGIAGFFSGAFAAFRSSFESIWNGISGTWSAVWNGMRDTAATVWESIKGVMARPINFVVRTVLRDGLFKAWNWVLDKLGISSWHVDTNSAWLQGIPGYAAGGHTGRGLFGTNNKNDPAGVVHADEYVEPQETVRYYNGTGILEALHQRAIDRNTAATLAAPDKGGRVGDSFLVRQSIAERTSRFLEAFNAGQAEAIQAAGGWRAMGPGYAAGGLVERALSIARAMQGTPYIWGGAGPGGADCSGFQSIITNTLRGKANPYSRVGSTATFPWPGFQSGYGTPYTIGNTKNAFNSGIGHMAGTLDTHRLESGSGHGPMVDGSALGANASMFGMHAWLNQFAGATASSAAEIETPWFVSLWHSVTGAYNWLKDSIKTVGEVATRFGQSPFTGWLMELPPKLLGGAWDLIKGKITTLFNDVIIGGNTTLSGTPRVRADVQQAANTRGWGTGAQWTALDNIISRESSWNPTAQNPSSSASGLFQMIDSTWAANRPASAAAFAHMKQASVPDQAQAGMRYIGGRYGTPTAAWAYWQAHRYYHDGGVVTGPGPDVPAWLTPDERVLTPQQDDYFRRFVNITEQAFGPDGRGSLVGNMSIQMASSDPRVVADEIVHRLRVANRGGVFAVSTRRG